ncbi:hypothetical protein [Nocardia asiatica]|uniref:hypothetical protein n=1 Tax=Nocardia asiatica TaxID=209252 RepID=UPI0024587205|nr:hypothetical protein [Nocardia asiatica]
MPILAENIPQVLVSMPEGATREHYGTYWSKILAQPGWGARRLDEPTTDLTKPLVALTRSTATGMWHLPPST